MLDAVEDSLRETFKWAARRASDVPANVAHLVGEVAAENWYRRTLPPEPEERALWLKGAQAVLPLIPLAPPAPALFNASSYRAIQGARRIIDIMIRQALDQRIVTADAADLMLIPPSLPKPALGRGATHLADGYDESPVPRPPHDSGHVTTSERTVVAARGPYRFRAIRASKR